MNYKKELPLIGIAIIPLGYLAIMWKHLPERVPLHWNIKGEIDRWGDKSELIMVVCLITALIYLLLYFVPKIDPKKKLGQMGSKFYHLRFIFQLIMSALAIFIIYSSHNQQVSAPYWLFLGVGLLYVILGNFFQSIKANYFVGIRTPWTLENETVWKATHRMAGKLWVGGGLFSILTTLVLPTKTASHVFIGITSVLVIVPILYSYRKFQQVKEE
ncbi:SdpI family protein [Leptobacterium sp. I13]|uniref:SdpI family protein n=1 Tax=Leptobacterium meishanense TaxID=3128904 RepID=UPI0030ED0C16